MSLGGKWRSWRVSSAAVDNTRVLDLHNSLDDTKAEFINYQIYIYSFKCPGTTDTRTIMKYSPLTGFSRIINNTIKTNSHKQNKVINNPNC